MPSAARVIAIAALVLSGCGSASADDPEDANCSTVTAQYGASRDLSDHREVDVRFSCEGAQQSATAYLPTGAGPYPGVVWVHGNGPERRLSYGPGITSALVQAGIAVLSYDKRGVGQSQGSCCPGDAGHFNLIAADATGAVNALSAMPGIDARHVGLIGASQAGWLIPIEATRSSKVAFIAVADGPTVTQGEERLYSLLTGEEGEGGGALSDRAISYRLRQAGPSDFDPLPFLERVSVPGIWVYAQNDRSIPAGRCARIVNHLKAAGKDFTVVTFPGAAHGLFDQPPSHPQAVPTVIAWVLKEARS